MLLAKQLPRVFKYKIKEKEINLADPEISYSPQAVLNFYSRTYPDLVTAKIEGPQIKNDQVEYKFTSTIGTKG